MPLACFDINSNQRISNKPKEPSLWFVSLQTVMYQRIGNMPKAKALKNYKIVNEVKILWRLVAVGNG